MKRFFKLAAINLAILLLLGVPVKGVSSPAREPSTEPFIQVLPRGFQPSSIHRGTEVKPATIVDLNVESDLDSYITERLAKAHMPGLSAAIVKYGETVWTGVYGWSKVWVKQPAQPETIFMLASVSKTITGTAVMKVVESGLLDLDTDINVYLPFAVRNPGHPRIPITTRMLLAHVSSIRDNWEVLEQGYTYGDSPVSLAEFLRNYLSPRGDYYYPLGNFYRQPPQSCAEYSNVGISLAAYLVEVVTGIAFDTYCNNNIFEPLSMANTSWRFADLDPNEIAMPYRYIPKLGLYHPYGYYGYPDYPDGGLRTTAGQLAKFLNMFIQQGTYEGVRILDVTTVEAMQTVQYPELDSTQGLVWYYEELNGWTLLGHNGGEMGVATEMFFRPEDGVGVILLMNGDWGGPAEVQAIMEIEVRLFLEADNY